MGNMTTVPSDGSFDASVSDKVRTSSSSNPSWNASFQVSPPPPAAAASFMRRNKRKLTTTSNSPTNPTIPIKRSRSIDSDDTTTDRRMISSGNSGGGGGGGGGSPTRERRRRTRSNSSSTPSPTTTTSTTTTTRATRSASMCEKPPSTITEPRRPRQQPQSTKQFETGDDVYVNYKDGAMYDAIIRSVQMVEEVNAEPIPLSPSDNDADSRNTTTTATSDSRPGQRVGSRNRGGGVTGGSGLTMRVLSYTVEFANGEVEENISASDIRDAHEGND